MGRGTRAYPAIRCASLVAAATLFLPGPAAADLRGVTAERIAAVESFLNHELSVQHIPGLALAIVDGGQVVYAHGFGVAGPDGTPVTPDTPFVLGSTSKALTALAVEQLVQSGHVGLDMPVATFVAELQGHPAWTAVRVRDLLGHESGLSTDAGHTEWDRDDDPADTLTADAQRLAGEPFDREPATSFEYSNANYDLLGYLVERVSGEPYAAYVEGHVFGPLGMSHSAASREEAGGLAAGYYPWFGTLSVPMPMAYVRSSVPSSFLISTANDLARELTAQLGGPSPAGGEPVLSPDGLAATRAVLARVDEANGYAMGWWVHPFWAEWSPQSNPDPATLPIAYDHQGSVGNYSSYVAFVPDRRLGVAILANTDDETEPWRIDHVQQGVMRILAGTQPLPADPWEDALGNNARLLYLLVPLLQVVLTLVGLRAVISRPAWWSAPARILLVGVVSLATLVALYLALVIAPDRADAPITVLLLRAPDLGVMTLVILATSAIWFGGLVVLSLRAARRPTLQADA